MTHLSKWSQNIYKLSTNENKQVLWERQLSLEVILPFGLLMVSPISVVLGSYELVSLVLETVSIDLSIRLFVCRFKPEPISSTEGRIFYCFRLLGFLKGLQMKRNSLPKYTYGCVEICVYLVPLKP